MITCVRSAFYGGCKCNTAHICCCVPAAIDQYLLLMGSPATNPPQPHGMDRQKHGQTDAHQFHRPCSVYYVSSVDSNDNNYDDANLSLISRVNSFCVCSSSCRSRAFASWRSTISCFVDCNLENSCQHMHNITSCIYCACPHGIYNKIQMCKNREKMLHRHCGLA